MWLHVLAGEADAVQGGVAEGKLVGGQVVSQNKRVPHRFNELGRDSSSPKNVDWQQLLEILQMKGALLLKGPAHSKMKIYILQLPLKEFECNQS